MLGRARCNATRREQTDGEMSCGSEMLRHSFGNSLEPQIPSFYSEPQDFTRADKGASYRNSLGREFQGNKQIHR